MRMGWDEYALNLATVASLRSEDPFQTVGACALDFDHRVLSVGYNGLVQGKDADPIKFWGNRDHRRKYMIHAEANCLSLFKSGECKILAVTLLPCSSCATLVAAYKIPTVVYKKIYERDSKALEIFDFYGINCYKI